MTDAVSESDKSRSPEQRVSKASGPHDPEAFRAKILPGLATVTASDDAGDRAVISLSHKVRTTCWAD
jgi:hypothetical protein